MKKTRMILIIVIGLGLISLLFLFLWGKVWPPSRPVPLLPLVREEEAVPVENNPVEKPSLVGVQIALVDRAQRLNWKLYVERVVEEDGICLLTGIEGEYYTLGGDQYRVQAPAGEMGKDFSWLRLSPEVNVSGGEIEMQVEELSWTAEAGEEITGRGLRIDGEKVWISAEKFIFNPDKGGITLPGESRWSFR
ncbi:MAG TPA: hypothetical protein GXZ98_02665 [Firmicutes bacterium]|jgi:hypothetical protein|nr:hypothetical protein [Bacillota bacterium]